MRLGEDDIGAARAQGGTDQVTKRRSGGRLHAAIGESNITAPDGNLFEPESGPGSDVTGAMRRSSGAGVSDGSGLGKLASAASQTNLSARWIQLDAVLDTDRFLTFMAMEVLLGHRDGYGLAKNNYRLYHDPAADRFVFLPSGMDQLLGRANFPLQPHMAVLEPV